MQISIMGYEQQGYCDHCGRPLKHCIRISDGRLVGATCFDKQLTKPKTHKGKPYRYGAGRIIELAKIRQFAPEHQWDRYGANAESFVFDAT